MCICLSVDNLFSLMLILFSGIKTAGFSINCHIYIYKFLSEPLWVNDLDDSNMTIREMLKSAGNNSKANCNLSNWTVVPFISQMFSLVAFCRLS